MITFRCNTDRSEIFFKSFYYSRNTGNALLTLECPIKSVWLFKDLVIIFVPRDLGKKISCDFQLYSKNVQKLFIRIMRNRKSFKMLELQGIKMTFSGTQREFVVPILVLTDYKEEWTLYILEPSRIKGNKNKSKR